MLNSKQCTVNTFKNSISNQYSLFSDLLLSLLCKKIEQSTLFRNSNRINNESKTNFCREINKNKKTIDSFLDIRIKFTFFNCTLDKYCGKISNSQKERNQFKQKTTENIKKMIARRAFENE